MSPLSHGSPWFPMSCATPWSPHPCVPEPCNASWSLKPWEILLETPGDTHNWGGGQVCGITGTTCNLPCGTHGCRRRPGPWAGGEQHSKAAPHHDGLLTTELQKTVAPWTGSGGWMLSPGQISGAEGWVGSQGHHSGGPATRSRGGWWLRAEVLFVVLVVLPMETGLVQGPSPLPVLPGTLWVLGRLCSCGPCSPLSCTPATMARPWRPPPPQQGPGTHHVPFHCGDCIPCYHS